MDPDVVLFRLFTLQGIRLPYQYFYRPKSFHVIPKYDLALWRDLVDDPLLRILARCVGHTRVATLLALDDCDKVTDAGVVALLPTLRSVTVFSAQRVPQLTDAAIACLGVARSAEDDYVLWKGGLNAVSPSRSRSPSRGRSQSPTRAAITGSESWSMSVDHGVARRADVAVTATGDGGGSMVVRETEHRVRVETVTRTRTVTGAWRRVM